MKLTSLTLVVGILGLVGCSSTSDYAKYADTQLAMEKERSSIGVAKAKAEEEKYRAVAAIAASGDVTAKVAGLMALSGMENLSGLLQGNKTVSIERPKSSSDIALQWASLIVPAATNIYGFHTNASIAETQSNNARDVAISTNNAFVGISGNIQAPAANINYSVSDSAATTIGEGTSGWTTSTVTTNTNESSFNPVTTDNSLADSQNPVYAPAP